jgi:hypothetical protein
MLEELELLGFKVFKIIKISLTGKKSLYIVHILQWKSLLSQL